MNMTYMLVQYMFMETCVCVWGFTIYLAVGTENSTTGIMCLLFELWYSSFAMSMAMCEALEFRISALHILFTSLNIYWLVLPYSKLDKVVMTSSSVVVHQIWLIPA